MPLEAGLPHTFWGGLGGLKAPLAATPPALRLETPEDAPKPRAQRHHWSRHGDRPPQLPPRRQLRVGRLRDALPKVQVTANFRT